MNKKNHSLPTRSMLAAALVTVLATGCAVTPTALTDREVEQRVAADQLRIYEDQAPISGPLTFADALGRSLKYNLDHRLKLMESALNMGLSDVAKFDMLPNLLVSAGYTERNNITGSRSFNIVNGEVVEPANPSYTGGQEKSRRLASAEFSWSVLDFGVGYYRAKQAANEYLIAEERRRRVVQNILQDVRSAYWRAVGAQRMASQADELMVRVRSALERSRKAAEMGLLPPKDALTYQRMLLDALNLLNARRQDLELAKRELAALMNVPPGTLFTLADEAPPALPAIPVNIQTLEDLAMFNRPELREEDYRTRITAAEARKQLLYLLPNISLNIGAQYDSNKYLYNNDWIEASTRVTFNLFRALSIPSVMSASEGQVKVDDMRRMALSMAILTQVRVAVERYRLALNDYEIAQASQEVDARMATYAQAALSSQVDSELELIRAETRAINSAFQRHAAYAAAQNAFGRIYNSVGLEVVPPGLENESLDQIGQRVLEHVRQIENNTFEHMAERASAPTGLRLSYAGADDTQLGEAIKSALSHNHYQVTDDANAPQLVLDLQMNPDHSGLRRAQWSITLQGPDGQAIGKTEYASTLSANPSPSSLRAFTEAAMLANLDTLSRWLKPAQRP